MPRLALFVFLALTCAGFSAEFRVDEPRLENGRTVVRFGKESGFYYILWRGDQPTDIRLATDLGLGKIAPDSLADTNDTNTAQFYRVEKVPLTFLRDTDGDGINDMWELLYRHPGAALNPADIDEDHDSNGVSDRIDALREALREGSVRGRPVLATGDYHTLAIRIDGTLWGWGDNSAGQLGSIIFTETNEATQIGTDTNWMAASAVNTVSYGLKQDGTLWRWGYSSTGSVFAPTQVGTNGGWIGLPRGMDFRDPTALRDDGTRWQFIDSFTNAQPYGASNDWAVVADDYVNGHWAIKRDGTLWKGLSIFDTNSVWTSISLGRSHALALKTNDTLWSWSYSSVFLPVEGQLGVDGLPKVPTQVGTQTWAAVSAGGYHSFGIKSDGSLWWWGANFRFDTNDSSFLFNNRPARLGTNTDWIALSAGDQHTVALRDDGTVWTFGYNELGKLGNGTVSLLKSPIQVETNQDWSAVATGADSSFGLKTNGTLWAWGRNRYGEQGVGAFDHGYILRQVPGSNWIAVSGGGDHTIALQNDGSLWVWGIYIHSNGAIANYVFTNVPTRLGTDVDWSAVFAGFQHSLALKTDGSLWAWGRNAFAELGTGGGSTPTPQRVGTAFWRNISAGHYNSLGVQTSSTLWVWGQDIGGIGQTSQQVTSTFDWKLVANGKRHSVSLYSHALALKRNGTLWAWGSNSRGQLGTNSTPFPPVQVGISTNWSQIAVGDLFSGALQDDGTLWMSGANSYGQLGFGTREDTNLFTRVSTGTNWTALAAGYRHVLALKFDGSIWAWGDNSYGQCAQPALFEPAPVGGTNWGAPRR